MQEPAKEPDADEARRHLAGRPVREIMAHRVETAPADMRLDTFVNHRLYATRHGAYPVVEMDRLIGVVEPANILSIDRERWPQTTLAEVCTALELTPCAAPDDDAFDILQRMRNEDRPRMLVLERGVLVGIVTLDDLLERLALASRFEPE
ncbi:CBS domain-containing protein [Brevundimonas sp.]|uniref:CBS domain-containing protein n=1 Tax=Brevundimonas sp. TaxID=1871086 RepID=UPI0035AE5601